MRPSRSNSKELLSAQLSYTSLEEGSSGDEFDDLIRGDPVESVDANVDVEEVRPMTMKETWRAGEMIFRVQVIAVL